MMTKFFFISIATISLGHLHPLSADNTKFYKIEAINMPPNTPPEVGAVKIDSKGQLFVALRRGDVITAQPVDNPKQFKWRLFGSGLHNPCGMEILAPNRILVSQMGELTELIDTDDDGKANEYNNITSSWGVSGNYHETNEICPDGEGGYFLAIGTASHNGPTFHNVRDEYSKIGRRGRNFSSVKWKGWILQYTKDGKTIPHASGFRMHNGICRDKDGNVWATDNEGDWRATTPLYHIEKGNFYGHPSSLVWDPNWPKGKDPLKMPLEEINKMRTRAAVLLPHKELCRSASEPIQIPEGFGPFTGQLLIPDNNSPRMARVMLEKVNGKFQGAATFFLNTKSMKTGGNRVVFSADGKTLYLGHTVRGWGKPGEGLTRISYGGKTPFDVHSINITKKGFKLNLTQDIAPEKASKDLISVKSYWYEDKWSYGGPKKDPREEKITGISATKGAISIELENMEAGRVYELNFSKDKPLENLSGQSLVNNTFYYTANQLLK